MAIKEVEVTAKKVKRRKITLKTVKIVGLVLFLVLFVLFLILRVIYNGGKFTITLDPNFALKTGLIIYEDKIEKRSQRRLFAKELEFMDNVGDNWVYQKLKENNHFEKDGAHNDENLMIYTFYTENTGQRTIDYWYEIDIDDVTRHVDEAIRIVIYRNGQEKVYAKINGDTKTPEKRTEDSNVLTTPFYSDKIAVLEQRAKMPPNAVDKFMIVVYLSGPDPDCLDPLIGGEIKMHMDIIESHIEGVDENATKEG
ncbi:MAG: hypothetical protein IJL74_00400 [Bacilli bacterium]|nr:hypothetical protein [Bacilli bacterium]